MSSKNYPFYRQAVATDLACIAHIHLEAFTNYFLSELGYKFLCVMYKAFIQNPAGVFVVCESKEGQVTGFAVGALSSGKKDRWIALRYLPEFLVAALPAIRRKPNLIVRRLVARFFETDASYVLPRDVAVLRSIGVLTSERGGGAASALLDAFEKLALQHGANQVYLTTDQQNNERAQNFYKRHGYQVAECFQQNGRRPMWLMSKLLRPVVHE